METGLCTFTVNYDAAVDKKVQVNVIARDGSSLAKFERTGAAADYDLLCKDILTDSVFQIVQSQMIGSKVL